MSGHSWKTTATESAELGRDVISLYLSVSDSSDLENCGMTDQLATALQNVIYSLDERWKKDTKQPPTAILKDNTFYETARTHASVRFASYGTADLFGITPATRSTRSMAELASDTRDITILQARLKKLSVKAVTAYERFLAILLELPASVRIEWASPNGEQSHTELNIRQIQASCSFINEIAETVAYIRLKGSLTAMNLAKRTFRMESEDGRVYTGRISDALKKQRSQEECELPVKAQALIERRTAFQASIGTESVVDTLVELDTNLGIDIREALHTLQELYARLVTSVEPDSTDVNRLGISFADYSELAELMNRLLKSNPYKGARRVLDPAEVAASHALLAEGRPIGRLAKFDPRGLHADADEANQTERAARIKAAEQLARLTTAACPDIVMLLKRLLQMIETLEDEITKDVL